MNVQATLPLSIQPEASQVVTAALSPSAAKLYQDHGGRIKPETAISCVSKTGKERKRGCSPVPTIQPACLGREDYRSSAQKVLPATGNCDETLLCDGNRGRRGFCDGLAHAQLIHRVEHGKRSAIPRLERDR